MNITKEPVAIDIEAINLGSITAVRPMTEAGETWLSEHVNSEPWQWFGGALAVEPRYVEALMQGAMDDGLAVRIE